MTQRRRIWSELLPYATLRSQRVLGLLQRYGLEVAVAVRPDTAAALPDVCAACADAGVPVAVWPMLADEDGRWAGAGNAEAFCGFATRVVDALDARGVAPAELCVDLEPPIAAARRALSSARGALEVLAAAPPRRAAERAYAALVADLGARGVAASAAAVPLVLLDGRERSFERALGTPVSAAPWSHVSVMLYTSMLEGWSRGLLRREDAVSLLAWGCRAASNRFGVRAGASLGAVGVGALGDEPVYRSAAELREDVAAAWASRVDRLSLFDLGGVLSRPPAEAWLEAFVAPPERSGASAFGPTVRARVAAAGAALSGRAAAGVRALGRLGRGRGSIGVDPRG